MKHQRNHEMPQVNMIFMHMMKVCKLLTTTLCVCVCVCIIQYIFDIANLCQSASQLSWLLLSKKSYHLRGFEGLADSSLDRLMKTETSECSDILLIKFS